MLVMLGAADMPYWIEVVNRLAPACSAIFAFVASILAFRAWKVAYRQLLIKEDERSEARNEKKIRLRVAVISIPAGDGRYIPEIRIKNLGRVAAVIDRVFLVKDEVSGTIQRRANCRVYADGTRFSELPVKLDTVERLSVRTYAKVSIDEGTSTIREASVSSEFLKGAFVLICTPDKDLRYKFPPPSGTPGREQRLNRQFQPARA